MALELPDDADLSIIQPQGRTLRHSRCLRDCSRFPRIAAQGRRAGPGRRHSRRGRQWADGVGPDTHDSQETSTQSPVTRRSSVTDQRSLRRSPTSLSRYAPKDRVTRRQFASRRCVWLQREAISRRCQLIIPGVIDGDSRPKTDLFG